MLDKIMKWHLINKDKMTHFKATAKKLAHRCVSFLMKLLVVTALIITVSIPFLGRSLNNWIATAIWIPAAMVIIIYDIVISTATNKIIHSSKDIKTFTHLCDVLAAYSSGAFVPVFGCILIINCFDTTFSWWWAGAIIGLVIAIVGSAKLLQIARIFSHAGGEKLRLFKKNVYKTATFYLIADMFYIAAFNGWSVPFFAFGTLALTILLSNVATAFLKKAFVYKGFLLHDFVIAMSLTIYLIYNIPNEDLQGIVLALISALYGGFIALVGVAWTIEDGQHRDQETKRLEKMPYLKVEFGQWMTGNARDGSIFPEKYLEIERSENEHVTSGGYSIIIDNIGLGMATNIVYAWKDEINSASKSSLPSFLLRCNESRSSNIIFSANGVDRNGQNRIASKTLEFVFDDILGNHYTQSLKLAFEVHPGYIKIVSSEMLAPEYVQL